MWNYLNCRKLIKNEVEKVDFNWDKNEREIKSANNIREKWFSGFSN